MKTEKELYRKMVLIRQSEEKIRDVYMGDEMKTPVHLGNGTEAINVGVHKALGEDLACFGTYRNHSLFLTLSEDTDTFFTELYGRGTSTAKGKAGSMHMSCPEHGLIATSAIVASTIPLAVGRAFANKLKKKDEFVAVFFGDGAVEEGVFWESLNFACLHKLKVLFVCEDNGLAIHTHNKDRQGFKTITEAVSGFKVNVETADGTDLLDVIEKTEKLKKEMASGNGPGLLYAPYFRFLEHVGINEDFAAEYREKPSDLEALDPIKKFEKHLASQGLKEIDLAEIRVSAQTQIDRSVERAASEPFAPADELYTDVYSD